MNATNRPLPAPDPISEPFWQAAKEDRLVVQRCQECKHYNHPPRANCDECLSSSLAWEAVSGLGTVWTFAIMHQPLVPGFKEHLPYVTALVELDEQPMLLLATNLPGLDPEQVQIGQRVKVTFEPLAEGLKLPQFVPAD